MARQDEVGWAGLGYNLNTFQAGRLATVTIIIICFCVSIFYTLKSIQQHDYNLPCMGHKTHHVR